MEKSLETINMYLVDVFNQILDIEETALAKSQFKDLSIKEMHTVEAIGLHGNLTTTTVANKLNITVGTLTVAINGLVKKGYVERLKHEADRRVVLLGLTNKGKLLYRLHRKFHEAMVQKTIQGLNDDEVKVLLKALGNLYGFLHEITLYNLEEELQS